MANIVSKDVLSYIFSFLHPRALQAVSCVSKAWSTAVVPEIWKNLQLSYFGKYLVPKETNLNWKQLFFKNQRQVEFPISIPFASNHFSVAKGCTDGKILLFSLQNTNKIHTYRKVILEGHQGKVTCLHWGFNEFLSGSEDRTIRSWDLRLMACQNVFKGHEGAITAVAPLRELILSASEDRTIRGWSKKDAQCIKTYSYDTSITFLVHLGSETLQWGSPKTLFGHKNGTLSIFDWQQTKLVSRNVKAHTLEITCIVGTPKLFFTGSKDGTVRCWTDLKEGVTFFSGHRSPITGLCLFNDKLYSSSCNGQIWECLVEDFFKDKELEGSTFYQSQGTAVYLKGQVTFGQKDFLFGWEDRQVKLWRIFKIAKREICILATHPEPVMSVCLVSATRTFFSISTEGEVFCSRYTEAAAKQSTLSTNKRLTKKRKF